VKVKGKVVVVSGAGSGMGRELVLELLRRGASVVALDINAAALTETEALAAEGALMCRVVNITDRVAVEALPAAIIERFGAVDGLINCAGIIQPFADFAVLDYAVIERVFDVNWRGTMYMTKTFLPHMLSRPVAHLVNISSMGGFMPFPGQSAYGASKAAVKLMTEALQGELAQTAVRVSVVFPGAVSTNIMQNSGLAADPASEKQRSKIYPASSAARDILNGMERNRARILVGSDAKLLDFLYRISPPRAAALIAWMMRKMMPQGAK
jgi:short-subunit dehydrogenase